MPTPDKINAVVESLKKSILAGDFGKRGTLPSRKQLEQQLKVSGDTLNRAMLRLQAQGYVTPSGRNVAANPVQLKVPGLTSSFDEFLEAQHLKPAFENIGTPEVIELEADLAHRFRLEPGTKAIRRLRRQGEDREGLKIWYRLAETYYLYDLASQWLATMQQNARFNVIRAINKETGKKITHGHSEIAIRFPTEQEVALLEATYDTPMGEHFRMCYSEQNELIMFNRIVSKGYAVEYVIDDYPISVE